MKRNTTHLDIEKIQKLNDPTQFSRILAACLYMYKAHTDYTWEKIAGNLVTTRKTLYKIRKAKKPIMITTFCDLLDRLLETDCIGSILSAAKKDSSKDCYKCHPDCPFKEDYQKEKAFEGILNDLLNLIK